MKDEQNNPYCIYSKDYSQSKIPNIVTDPLTEKRLLEFGKNVVDMNTRLERIAELKAKFGFTSKDNSKQWREKLTKPQITNQKINEMAKLVHKMKLAAAFNNNVVGC